MSNNSWYDKYIEKPIQSSVRLLRNNGFNTESSCGHEMYVQCQYIQDGEIQRLDNLLFNQGYRDYSIEISIKRVAGHSYTNLLITLANK